MKPIYLRLDEQLDKALRREFERRKKTNPTTTLADLVREILRDGLAAKKRESK